MLKQGLAMAAGFAVFNVGAKAIGFVKDQLTSTITVAMQHQEIMAQTAQAIKSTGDASGLSAKQIGDLALSLSKTTEFSDDTVQSAENLLLTFTGIGKKTFPEATQTALDMAQALKEGPTQAAMQLGKALNDPTTGLTALQRVGVTFSAQEKEQIATMMAHKDVAGAQAVMLKELQTEFGGSAKAAGQTFGGQLQILKNRLMDVKQEIGGALLPGLTALVGGISSNVMPALEGFADWFAKTAIPAIGGFGTYVSNVFRSLDLSDFSTAWIDLKEVVRDTAQTFGLLIEKLKPVSADVDPIADAIGTLAHSGLQVLTNMMWKAYEGISAFNNAFHGGKGPIVDLANGLKELGPPLQNIGNLLKGELGKEFKDLGQDAQQVGQWFMSSVVPAIKQALPGFENLGRTILTTVIPAAIQIRGVFVDVIQHAFEKFAPIIEKIVPPLIKFAGVLANDIANGLKFIMPYVLQAAKAIGQFADEIIDRVAPIVSNGFNAISVAVGYFMKGWMTAWPMISAVLAGVWDEMVGWVQIAWALISGIIKIGLDIMSGNWKQVWKDAQDMLKGVWDGIVNILKGAWKIITGIFTNIYNDLIGHSIIPDLINGIISWFASLPGKVVSAIQGLGGMINNIWNNIINDAKNAGTNIVKGIADAINGAIHFVTDAITNVTNWISSHLPHSPAKVGPLRDLQMQGGMITQQIGEGMLANMPKLNLALAQLVKPIAMTLSPGGIAALPAGTSGIPASVSQATTNSANAPVIYIQNFIDGKPITDNAATRIIKSVRTSGPIRSNLQ